MSDGARHCWHRGVRERKGKWYCNRCYKKTEPKKQPPKSAPKSSSKVINPAGRLSDRDLQTLYKNVKKYQESGGTADPYSSKVLINEILPSLLLEVMALRGVEPK